MTAPADVAEHAWQGYELGRSRGEKLGRSALRGFAYACGILEGFVDLVRSHVLYVRADEEASS